RAVSSLMQRDHVSQLVRAADTDEPALLSSTTPSAAIDGDTAPDAGSPTFANLADTGHTDTPTPITTDGTFDLSLSGDTDANGVAGVVYQQNLNDASWTDLPGSSLSGLADGSYQFRAVVTANAGNSSNTTAISVTAHTLPPAPPTLTFANLADTGHTDTPTPITTDGTFDLSLSGDTDANGVAGVVYQQNLNGAGWTDLPDRKRTRLNYSHT